MGRSKPRQPLAVCTPEDRARWIAVETVFGDQSSQGTGEIGGDRQDPFPAPLAAKEHLGPGPVELEIADIDAQCFRDPGTGAAEEQQQGPIAAPSRGPLAGRVDQRIQLVAGEVMGGFGVRSPDRDSENPVGDAERFRIGGRDMLEEGPDRCQPRIARLGRVPSRRHQIVEKGENGIAVESIDGQGAWLTTGPAGRKQDQQAQCISIAGDRRWTRIALLGHPMAEEGLQQRWEGRTAAHDGSRRASARSAAMASRSAPAVT